MSYLNVSKSTKRRRYLEDVETINFVVENQQSQVSLQPSMLQDDDSNLPIGVKNVSLINTDIPNCYNTNAFKFSFPTINSSDHSESELISMLSSDSDDETAPTKNFNKILHDNDSVLKLLAKWAVECNITLTALSSLLKVKKVHSCFNDFSVDGRTLLKVNNNCKTNTIDSIEPGLYYHFGIAYGLKSDNNLISILSENIKLVISVDGLPLTKSSSSMFWPILGYVRYPGKPRMFLIGLYWGREKPCSSNLFLKNLVNELKDLSENGMETDFGKTFVFVDTFCCDSPAKSFILCTKGHAGYSSCSRCTVDSERVNNTTCFLGSNFPKRTHISFLNRSDDEYHIGDTYRNGGSNFT